MTQPTLFDYTQQAVDIVHSSRHPENKIAATLTTADRNFTVSAINHWPESIERKIGTAHKIGNSSGTIHAETACLIRAIQSRRPTLGAALFITDPPCPNCAKNMAEAGIASLYIDHKGFEKDFALRRHEDIQKLSLQVFKHAGINVYKIFRREQKLEPLHEAPENYRPHQIKPPHITVRNENADWKTAIQEAQESYGAEPFAMTLGKNPGGETLIIACDAHPSLGYETERMLGHIDADNSKYSTVLEPLNRLLMLAARHGIQPDPQNLYSSRCPTSRELVNLLGAGFQTLTIGNENLSRDEYGPHALAQLKKAGIITTRPL